jgi:hypothetical protein
MAKQTDGPNNGRETPNIHIDGKQSIIHDVPVHPGDISTAAPKVLHSNLKFRIGHISMNHFFPEVVGKAISHMCNNDTNKKINLVKNLRDLGLILKKIT